MSERPILFNAEMVRAVMRREKTQTRRVIKDRQHGTTKCPYGEPGNHLWVRETFCEVTGPSRDCSAHAFSNKGIAYRADYQDENFLKGCWKPSIFMPRWASRLTLEVIGVRLERVQDISEHDAWDEGFPDYPGMNKHASDRARYWFKNLWDSINEKRGHGWDKNPLVWVVKFHLFEERKEK